MGNEAHRCYGSEFSHNLLEIRTIRFGWKSDIRRYRAGAVRSHRSATTSSRSALNKDIVEPGGQLIDRKRLGQNVHAGKQVTAVEHSIFGIAGDEQHIHIRPPLAYGVGHLTAIHTAWQTDIRDQQSDAHVRLKHLQP